MAALARGAVVMSTHKGVEYYHFTSIEAGERKEFVTSSHMTRSKATTTSAFKSAQDMMEKLQWTIKCDDSVVLAIHQT